MLTLIQSWHSVQSLFSNSFSKSSNSDWSFSLKVPQRVCVQSPQVLHVLEYAHNQEGVDA